MLYIILKYTKTRTVILIILGNFDDKFNNLIIIFNYIFVIECNAKESQNVITFSIQLTIAIKYIIENIFLYKNML